MHIQHTSGESFAIPLHLLDDGEELGEYFIKTNNGEYIPKPSLFNAFEQGALEQFSHG